MLVYSNFARSSKIQPFLLLLLSLLLVSITLPRFLALAILELSNPILLKLSRQHFQNSLSIPVRFFLHDAVSLLNLLVEHLAVLCPRVAAQALLPMIEHLSSAGFNQ